MKARERRARAARSARPRGKSRRRATGDRPGRAHGRATRSRCAGVGQPDRRTQCSAAARRRPRQFALARGGLGRTSLAIRRRTPRPRLRAAPPVRAASARDGWPARRRPSARSSVRLVHRPRWPGCRAARGVRCGAGARAVAKGRCPGHVPIASGSAAGGWATSPRPCPGCTRGRTRRRRPIQAGRPAPRHRLRLRAVGVPQVPRRACRGRHEWWCSARTHSLRAGSRALHRRPPTPRVRRSARHRRRARTAGASATPSPPAHPRSLAPRRPGVAIESAHRLSHRSRVLAIARRPRRVGVALVAARFGPPIVALPLLQFERANQVLQARDPLLGAVQHLCAPRQPIPGADRHVRQRITLGCRSLAAGRPATPARLHGRNRWSRSPISPSSERAAQPAAAGRRVRCATPVRRRRATRAPADRTGLRRYTARPSATAVRRFRARRPGAGR